jgi:hypothetical protein
MHGPQVIDRHMGVYLGRFQRVMPLHFLQLVDAYGGVGQSARPAGQGSTTEVHISCMRSFQSHLNGCFLEERLP